MPLSQTRDFDAYFIGKQQGSDEPSHARNLVGASAARLHNVWKKM